MVSIQQRKKTMLGWKYQIQWTKYWHFDRMVPAKETQRYTNQILNNNQAGHAMRPFLQAAFYFSWVGHKSFFQEIISIN